MAVKRVTTANINRWLKRIDRGTLKQSEVKKIMSLLEGRRKLANSRLSSLQKAGFLEIGMFGSQSGKTALSYARSISGKYNAKSFFKQKNIVDALEQGLYIEKFLMTEQSTVRGTKNRKQIISENYKKKFKALQNYSDDELSRFMDFMNESSMQDFLSFFADYREAVEMLGTIFQEESGEEFLNDVFEKIQEYMDASKNEDYLNITEGLTVREARDAIQKRYNSILERRRR